MKTISLLLTLLLLCSCSYRQMQTSLVVTALVDDATTRMCLNTGHAEEANSLYGDNQNLNTLIRLGMVGAQLLVAHLFYQRDETAGKFMLLAASFINVSYSMHNLQVYISIKKRF